MLRASSQYILSSNAASPTTTTQPLPIGVMFSPTPDTSLTSNNVQPDGQWRRCVGCGGRPCPWSEVERGTWTCVFCLRSNPLGANAMSHESNRFEFKTATHVVFLGNKTTAGDCGSLIFVVDLVRATMDFTQDLDRALQHAPEGLKVGLVAYENGAARVFRLGIAQRGRVVSDLFSTWEPMASTQGSFISSRQNRHDNGYVAPLHHCRETLLSAMAGFAPCRSQAPRRWSAAVDEEPGRAIEYALLLLESSGAPSGTVVLLSGSTPFDEDDAFCDLLDEDDDVDIRGLHATRYDTTNEYFSSLAAHAAKLNYTIEIISNSTTGTTTRNTMQLLALGRVSYLPSSGVDGEGVIHSLQTLVARCVEENWPIEVRHSPTTLQQAMILGCTRQVPLQQFPGASSCQLIRGCSLSVFFEPVMGKGVPPSHPQQKSAFVQCVSLVPSTKHQGLLEVVCTLRFSLVNESDPHNLLIDSVDEECAAVLIAKGITATLNNNASIWMNSDEGQEAEDTVTQLLRSKVKQLVAQANTYRASTSIPRLLYHFQRSPLMHLVSGGWSPSLVHCLRARFLGAHLEEAMLMMMPKLYGLNVGREEEFHVVSPSTLFLRSNWVLVCDCLDIIIIWIGQDVSEDWDRRHALNLARNLALSRFPASSVRIWRENEAEANEIRHRLSPDHKHSIETLVGMVGGDLSFDQLNRLRRHLLDVPNDEATFDGFLA